MEYPFKTIHIYIYIYILIIFLKKLNVIHYFSKTSLNNFKKDIIFHNKIYTTVHYNYWIISY